MKVIRTLSIIGILLAFIGFMIGFVAESPDDFDVLKAWIFLITVYFTSLCIVCLYVIRVSKKSDRIKELEEAVRELQEKSKESKTE